MSPSLRPVIRHALCLLSLLLALLVMGCSGEGPEPTVDVASDSSSPTAASPPWFEDTATTAGIDFVHQSGHRDLWWMPEIMAGGAAWIDYDDDGDLDAYLVQAGRYGAPDDEVANALYENLGDGTFRQIPPSPDSDHDDTGYGMGVATGDVDGDGDVDLFVTNVGRDTLLLNQGGGRFEDVTEDAGVGHDGWGSSAVFVDIDRDGDQDLMVTTYLRWSPETEIPCHNELGGEDYCSPQSYDAPESDLLYENLGDGTFRDISIPSGIASKPGTGLGVVADDVDGDGWLDLFVANDGMPDRLWINLGDGRFEDRALLAGCAVDQGGQAKAGMGVAMADLDSDGDSDLLVGNLNTESDSFFQNQGGHFLDVTARGGLAAVSRPFTRFGLAWMDFDNDGQIDLYQANGRVVRHSQSYSDDPFAEPDLVYRGLGGMRFEELEPRGGTAKPWFATGRAAAFGDSNNDGGVDVLIINRDGPAVLLHNTAPRGHWLLLDVRDRRGAPALGARVSVPMRDGPRSYTVRSGYSYQAANDPRVHVGLGSATSVERVQIQWIDGTTTDFGPLDGNQIHRLQRPDGSQ